MFGKKTVRLKGQEKQNTKLLFIFADIRPKSYNVN